MNPDYEMLYGATANLINQQFYMEGTDTIIGRTPEVHLKVRKSGQLIQKFKNLFNDNVNLFLEGKIKDFVALFKNIKGLDNQTLKEITEEIDAKLETLKGVDVDMIVLYTLVISSIITRIRDLHFNLSIDEVRRRAKERASKITDSQIKQTLDNLFMRNNGNISILYNISYLGALADTFNYKKISHVCSIQKSKFINRVVKIIMTSRI